MAAKRKIQKTETKDQQPPARWSVLYQVNGKVLESHSYFDKETRAQDIPFVIAQYKTGGNEATAIETDGHWPFARVVPGLGSTTVIACECGWAPDNRPARMSMQHTPHQAHRRTNKLQPVEYAWPEDRYLEGLSDGTYQTVRDAHWDAETGKFIPDGYGKLS